MKRFLRNSLLSLQSYYYRKILKLDIHPTVRMSLSAKLDSTFRAGIHIDEGSYVAFGARILTHDFTRGLYLHTYIGKNCFIGGQSIILPGVKIGDGCIIGAGAIVTKDVPSACAVAGNPAQIVKRDIVVELFGRLVEADENERRLRESDSDAAKLPDRQYRKRQAKK